MVSWTIMLRNEEMQQNTKYKILVISKLRKVQLTSMFIMKGLLEQEWQ